MRFQSLSKLLFLIMMSQLMVIRVVLADPSSELVYNLKGTIVKVHTVTKSGRHGSGSGVVVAENLVATNCHVLADSVGSNVTAMGETYIPEGVRADWKHDVCILRFQFLPLKPATFADEDQLIYETSTFSVGFPGGAVRPLTTTGKIKALYAMDDSHVIRTSASFQMGASGSPLFNNEGKLIGLNTVKSPGINAYYYNVPAKWIKAAMALPETDKVIETDTAFWDKPLEKRPYWMQVVLPMQAGKWQDLLVVANEWQQHEPNEPEAIYYDALAQYNLGAVELAKAEFKRVVTLNPQHTSSILALAKIAKEQGAQVELKDLSRMLSVLDEDALEQLNTVEQAGAK